MHLKQYEEDIPLIQKVMFETMISFTSTLASLKLKVAQMIPIYAKEGSNLITINHFPAYLTCFSLPISD